MNNNPSNQNRSPSLISKSRFGFLAAGVAIGALAISGAGLIPGKTEAHATPSIGSTIGVQAAVKANGEIAPLPVNRAGVFSFADVVERVSPAVVSVLVEREVEAPQRGLPRGLPPGFERFFGLPGGRDDGPQNDNDDGFEDDGIRRAQAEGSGFFIDSEGHVVTNHHVIADADSVKISLSDGTELDAEVIGSDEFTDLAVLKVKESPKQPFVGFADEEDLRVGDWVVAVGNPFGLGGTVTSGIVSAIGGDSRQQQFVDYIQIDAAINRGNSGGPAFDLSGKVVGVNVAIYSPNGGSVGIGFAIPASTVKSTVAQLISDGKVTRGWLGIELAPVSSDIAQALELANTQGVLVNEVLDDTPAAKGGLQNGDVITEIDGKVVKGPNDLSRRIANLPPGYKLKVKLVRDGSNKNFTVTLGKRGEEQTVAAVEPEEEVSTAEALGVRVASITNDTRERFRLSDGVSGVVVTAVKPGSPAERAGLQPGVVVLELDNKKISSPKDFENKIGAVKKSKKGAALMRLQRGSTKQYSALKLDAE